MKTLGMTLLCALLAVVSLNGCQTQFIAPGQTLPPDMSRLSDADALKALQGGLFSTQTLKASGVDAVFKSSAEKASCDLHIWVRAPDEVRLLGQKAPFGDVFTTLIKGDLVKSYVTSEKTLYILDLKKGGRGRLEAIPWPMLLGVRPEPPKDFVSRTGHLSRAGKGMILELPAGGGGELLERVILDPPTLLPRLRFLQWSGGSGAIEAEYAMWTRVGDLWWPGWVRIRVPEKNAGKFAEVQLFFNTDPKKLKLNESIPPAAFRLDDLPEDTKTVHLDQPQ
jgi:hypothetical protein